MKTSAITPLPAAAPSPRIRGMRVVTPILFTLDIRHHHFSDLTLSEVMALHQVTRMLLESSLRCDGRLLGVYGVIAALVCEEFDIHVDKLTQRIRTQRYAVPRQVAMFLLREHRTDGAPSFSLNAIGEIFKRDHGTVMHACRAITNAAQTQPSMRARLQKLRTLVAAGLQTSQP